MQCNAERPNRDRFFPKSNGDSEQNIEFKSVGTVAKEELVNLGMAVPLLQIFCF